MIKVYSKVDPSLLLHVVSDLNIFSEERVDISAESEPLQVSVSSLAIGHSPDDHSHLTRFFHEAELPIQESWFILSGTVLASYFDLDDSLIRQLELPQGFISISFGGGHGLKVLEQGTRVLEHKTGPYLGRSLDKRVLGN
jgi:hypothetical protein